MTLRIGKFRNLSLSLVLAIAFSFVLSQISYATETGQSSLPTGELPLLITSAGQSPGGTIVSILCKRNKIECEYQPLAKAEILEGFKTLIIAIGSSMKGMGAAGIYIEDELTRMDEIIEEAREQKMLILGVHIEGEARRGGHCEECIDSVAPRVDYLIVRSDGNKDGRFDRISIEKKIPMTIIEETLEFSDLLKAMFGKTDQGQCLTE